MRARTVRAIKRSLKIDASAKLPKRLFVRRRIAPENGTTPFFEADATSDSAENGDVVGLYELVATKQMRITRTLE